MTNEQLEELKRLAEAACALDHNEKYEWYSAEEIRTQGAYYPKNARFIAAANPSAILDLLWQLEEAQAENERLRKDAERYRWLRTNRPIHDSAPFIARNFGTSFSQWADEYADAAIDAALSKVTK